MNCRFVELKHCITIFGFIAVTSTSQAAEVRYYPVSAGTHPHDVAAAPDGNVWYTAQRTGHLGILDPKTGKTEHIALGKGSSPHGVVVGPDGAAWITDSGHNAIVRFDPKTRAVTLFPLPAGTYTRQTAVRDSAPDSASESSARSCRQDP